MLKKLLVLVAALAPLAASAQGTVNGTVTDAAGTPLPGATVVLRNTPYGAATDAQGQFTLSGVPVGDYILAASYVGYASAEEPITVRTGETTVVNFVLAEVNQELEAASVFASRAIDRRTPVAFTDIPKAQIQQQLGSRDIPLVLNVAPSVYATESGGGAGDARINVRGFDQRNTAVMINGVPINDMENGWVYWSNWDGVGDVTTSIQLQRGLAAVNLAVPSVGGTLNILTDPASNAAGVLVQQEVGSGSFFKTTARASTGLMDNGLAFTALGVRKMGDGIVDGTWTDAWAYYFAGSYRINPRHTVSLYAVGAPQRHGQNLFRQNIAVYDEEFALSLDGYDPAALQGNSEGGLYNEAGREFNQNWAPVSPSYTGLQAAGNDTFERYDAGFLNERENFFHRPQVNLNWYAQLTDRLLLSTVAYYGGGSGGGTGTLGSSPVRVPFDGGDGSPFDSLPWTWDWDATIARNRSEDQDPDGDGRYAARTILRNSRNDQTAWGAISKLTMTVGNGITAEVGVDARTATIAHYREVRDLLGADFFVDNADFFAGEREVGLGDKVEYYNENNVNWLGGYAQAEVVRGPFTAFGMGGVTSTSYDFEDFFNPDPDDPSRTLRLESDNLVGYQVKGGALYNVSPALGVYANLGYISKTPIFDGVINDVTGTLNPDPKNEDIVSIEGGVNFRTEQLALKLAAYRTSWANRTINRSVDNPVTGEDALVFLRGVEQLHMGVELEGAYQPFRQLRFDAGLSVGDWGYTSDVTGDFQLADRSASIPVLVPIDGLKVGDQPQTQLAYAVTVRPIADLNLQLLGRTYARHYAAFDPLSRSLFDEDGDGTPDGEPDRAQSWMAPGYTVFDFNANYVVPLTGLPVGLELTANVFNLLDETYILDATDNSSFSSWDQDHDADDAEVFLGLPRRFNVGARLTF